MEAVVALLLLGLVLVFTLFTLFSYPRYREAVTARGSAYRNAEAVLESVRSGEVPVNPGEYEVPALFPGPAAMSDLRILLRVHSTARPSLFEIEIEVDYLLGEEPRELELNSLVYRP